MLVSRSAENLEVAAASLRGAARHVAWTVAHVGRPEQADVAGRGDASSGSARSTCSSTTPAPTPTWARCSGSTTSGCRRPTRSTRRASSRGRAPRGRSGCRTHGGVILNIASIGGLGAGAGDRVVQRDQGRRDPPHAPARLRARPDRAGERASRLASSAPSSPAGSGRTTRSGSPRTSRSRRIGEVDDIAPMALLLVSDAASWITGQTVVVDGGTTTQPSGGVG